MERFKKIGKLGTFLFICLLCVLALATCADDKAKEKSTDGDKKEKINLFVAASLTASIEEIVKDFEKENPNIQVLINADSSGKLKTQIMEGFDCDLFFSASTREVDDLIENGLIEEKDSAKILENKLAVIGHKDFDGEIKNLIDVQSAGSISIPYGSVPAGFYTRKALIGEKILSGDAKDKEAIKKITGGEISEALGGVTISEEANASTTITSVAEKSTELGLAYASDVKRNDNTKVILVIPTDLTGEIVYPLAKIKPKGDTSSEHKDSVEKLFGYLQSGEAKKVYENYGFSAR